MVEKTNLPKPESSLLSNVVQENKLAFLSAGLLVAIGMGLLIAAGYSLYIGATHQALVYILFHLICDKATTYLIGDLLRQFRARAFARKVLTDILMTFQSTQVRNKEAVENSGARVLPYGELLFVTLLGVRYLYRSSAGTSFSENEDVYDELAAERFSTSE